MAPANESKVFAPPPGVEVRETATLRIWLGDDGVARIVCKPGTAHGAAEAEENVAAMPPGHAGPVLADIRLISSVNKAARAIYRRPGAKTTAIALVVGSPLSRAIGNFFVGLSRLPFPARLFTSPTKALDWIRQV